VDRRSLGRPRAGGAPGRLARAVRPGLARLARGEPPTPPGEGWNDVDGLNQTFAQHAKGKLREEVLFELERAVEHFKQAADKLPDSEFEDEKVARKLMERAGIRHFRQHADMIRAWRPELQRSPILP